MELGLLFTTLLVSQWPCPYLQSQLSSLSKVCKHLNLRKVKVLVSNINFYKRNVPRAQAMVMV